MAGLIFSAAVRIKGRSYGEDCLLASTGRSEYLICVLLISNHRLIELLRKIHHQKMQRHRQLFNNACRKIVEWEDEEKVREKEEEGEKEKEKSEEEKKKKKKK
ncbi:hypothetical protein FSHL1_005206 [Fusarium sambucinum]